MCVCSGILEVVCCMVGNCVGKLTMCVYLEYVLQ